MSEAWLVTGRDSAQSSFVGPLIDGETRDCLDCIRIRLASCGARLDRLVPAAVAGPAAERLIDAAAQAGPGGTARLHRVPPMPFCRCARMARFAGTPLGLSDAVSPLFGPIQQVAVEATPDGETLAIAQGARLNGSAGLPALVIGSATARSAQEAVDTATAEALERYAAAFWDASRLGARPRTVAARHCGTRALLRVPADWVFMPYDVRTRPDAAGLAAGRTPDEARRRALAESIERYLAQSVLIACAPPASAPRQGEKPEIVELCLGRQEGFEVWMSWQARSSAPWHVMGLGCAETTRAARAKARRERRHVLAHMRRMQALQFPPSAALGWLDALVIRFARERAAGDLLREICGRHTSPCAATSVERAEIDVTTPDVAAFGLTVMRVVALDTCVCVNSRRSAA